MGLFDTVFFKCPNCNSKIEIQSKAGECKLNNFHSSEVPINITADLLGDEIQCKKCKEWFIVRGFIPNRIKLYLNEKIEI